MPDEFEQGPWAESFPGGLGVLHPLRDASGTVRLASAGSDHTIQVWDLRQGTTVGDPIIAHNTAVWALTSWVDDGGHLRLASSAEEPQIRVWDPDTGERVAALQTGHIGWISTLVSWRDGAVRRIASAGFDATVRVWDPDTGTQVGPTLSGHTGPILKLFHWRDRDGNRLASTSDDGTIRVWDADRGVPLGDPLPGHGSGMWGLTGWTTADGRARIAAAGTDGAIVVWDPAAHIPIGPPLRGHRGAVGALTAWRADDGIRLASLGSDGEIRFWDPEAGTSVGEPVSGTSGWLPALASWVESDGTVQLACGDSGGAIRVWDFATGRDVVARLSGHTSSMWALTSWTTPDGNSRIATGGDDAVIHVWSADTGNAVGAQLAGHSAGIWALTSWSAPDGGGRLASAGDDAEIRVWNSDTGEPVGQPLTGHTGWVTALAVWTAGDGTARLASAGIDGTVRMWDPEGSKALGPPLVGDGRIQALAVARTDGGRVLLAAGGTDGVLLLWDTETRVRVGGELRGHTDTVRGLTGWTHSDGSARYASASFDGTIRVWDASTGTSLFRLSGHDGQVARVIAWQDRAGRVRLASAGDDATIRIWDPDTGVEIDPPLRGHTAGVWALTTWTASDGRTVLASSGEDGTVRLWDPVAGSAIRTIEVGPVTLWGLSDAPSVSDSLGRRALADAVADQLRSAGHGQAGGPMVVSVEGPWGCGKTTFMQLVRARLAEPTGPEPAAALDGRRRLTMRRAVAAIRDRDVEKRYAPTLRAGDRSPTVGTGLVTAWFNPWAHQSGEQVWAGLVDEVIEASAEVLFPDRDSREWYWFTKNLARVDRFALRRTLARRSVSPLLGIAMIAVIVPLAIAVARLNERFTLGGWTLTTAGVALAVAVAFFAVGLAHTFVQYCLAPAAHFLPGEMLHRPVQDGVTFGAADTVPDPLNRARAGSLYLYQHDIDEVLGELSDRGYQMVIFIDDLDRCRMTTIVEVFEAINIFLAGLTTRVRMQARFVIGLDPEAVAGHLMATAAFGEAAAPSAGWDRSAGWAYLRKLIQLPVVMPRVSDTGITGFVDQVVGSGPEPVKPSPEARPALRAERSRAASSLSPPAPAEIPVVRHETLVWRSLEQHPQVRDFIVERLAARPDRSIRDAKRLLNVWQLLERFMVLTRPVSDPPTRIHRAKHLVLLAEIVTRWPSLQSSLNSWHPQGRGLQILNAAAGDDASWQAAVATVVGNRPVEAHAVDELRQMLLDHDGQFVAQLAAEVL